MKKFYFYTLALNIFLIFNANIYSMFSATRASLQPTLQQTSTMLTQLAANTKLPIIRGTTIPTISKQTATEAARTTISEDTIQKSRDALARRGIRPNAQGFEQFTMQHPEALKLAQYYTQIGNQTAARNMFDYLANAAKITQAEVQATSITNSLQQAIEKNPMLEDLVNKINNEITYDIIQPLSKAQYQSHLTNTPHLIESRRLAEKVQNELFTTLKSTKLTPQQAANKLLEINRTSIKNLKLSAEKLSESTSESKLQLIKIIDTLENDISKLQKILRTTSNQTAATQTPTLAEFDAMVEKLSHLKSPTTKIAKSPELVPVAKMSQATTSTQQKPILKINEALENAMSEHTVTFSNAILEFKIKFSELQEHIKNMSNLTQTQSHAISKITSLIETQLTTINKIFTKLAQHNDPQSAIHAYMQYADLVVQLINDIALLLSNMLNTLTPSQQLNIQPFLETLISALQNSNNQAQALQFIATEVSSEASAIKMAKKLLNELALRRNVENTIDNINSAATTLEKILQENSAIIKTDQAPMSMVEIVQKDVQQVSILIMQLQNAQNMNEIESSLDQLQQTVQNISRNLNAIESKVENLLPASKQKNQALHEIQKMRHQATDVEHHIKNFIEKLSEINEIHVILNITKNELQYSILRLSSNIKEAITFLTITHPINQSSKQQTGIKQLEKIRTQLETLQKKLSRVSNPIEPITPTEALHQLIQEINPETQKLLKPGKPTIDDIRHTIESDYQFLKHINVQDILRPLVKKTEFTLKETLQLFGLKMAIAGGLFGLISLIPSDENEQQKPKSVAIQIKELQEVANALPALEQAAQKEASDPVIQMQALAMKKYFDENKNLTNMPASQIQHIINNTKSYINSLNLQDYRIIQWLKALSEYINRIIQDAKTKGIYQTFSEEKQRLLEAYNQWLQEQSNTENPHWDGDWNPDAQ